jgi:alkaline phosphatase D
LYTRDNVYFPYAELMTNLAKHQPHALASLGDQFYENVPTLAESGEFPNLDLLYRQFLWLWTVRELTRNIPILVITDDHDVYQGNLWGHEGASAPGNNLKNGGYVRSPAWVNLVQRIQTGHNPDAFDSTPIQQGITVSYGAFTYGGISFGFVEDRKHKYGPDPVDPNSNPTTIDTLPLLGARQELFLDRWRSMHAGQPKVLMTSTVYAVVQTEADGSARQDPDTQSYRQARDRALGLVKAAGAVLVSGDRWFEPPGLPNALGTPYTGDFTDGYGNKFRSLAIANPRVTQANYRAAKGKGNGLGDRALKREGYGLVHIDKRAGQFVFESWSWDVDPKAAGAKQFPGWPYRLLFSDA